MTAGSNRLPGLDGLRGLAALAVVGTHFELVFVPTARIYDVLPIQRAYLAVDLFFLLSGYVLAHVYGSEMAADWRHAWRRFAIARFARLYPLFILTIAVLLAIRITGRLSSKYVTFSYSSLALQPLMLQAWHYGLNWNYPSWSISTELGAYILFVPAAGLMLRGGRPWLLAAACMLVLSVLCVLKGGYLNMGSQAPGYARTLAGFTLGVLLFRAMKAKPSECLFAAWVTLFPSIIVAALTRYDIFAIPALISLVAIAVSGKGLVSNLLDTRPLRVLGDWSYGIYLWHAPVSLGVAVVLSMLGIYTAKLGMWDARLLALATLLLVMLVTAFVYRYFEVPMRRWIPSLFGVERPVSIQISQSSPT